MAQRRELSARERIFVREYRVDLNARQAAIRAGYSRRSASRNTHKVLYRPRVAAVALLALLYGRRSHRLGKAQGREALLERSLEAAREAGAMDEDVVGLPDAVLYDELRRTGRQ